MANYVLDKSFIQEGTAAVSAYYPVKFGAGGAAYCQNATVAGEAIIGIRQESVDAAKVATGKVVVSVRVLGISKAVAGAAFSAGAYLAVAVTSGKLITATTGNRVIAMALTASGADGDLVDVILAGPSAQYLSA